MKKTVLMMVCLFLGIHTLIAQETLSQTTPHTDWVLQAGGSGDDMLLKVQTDASGNQYLFGYTANGLQVGSHSVAKGYFIAMVSPAGETQWATRLANPVNAPYTWHDMHVSKDGRITLAGTSNHAIIYARYSATGEMLWAHRLGTEHAQWTGYAVAADSQDNIYLTGSVIGKVEHKGSLMSTYSYIAYYMKATPTGQVIWMDYSFFNEEDVHTFITPYVSETVSYTDYMSRIAGRRVMLDQNEAPVFMTDANSGYAYEYIVYHIGTGTFNPYSDFYIFSRFSKNGQVQVNTAIWSRIENPIDITSTDMDKTGNIYVTTNNYNPGDAGGPTTLGVYKINTNGSIMHYGWAIGSDQYWAADIQADGIAAGHNGEIYVIGRFNENIVYLGDITLKSSTYTDDDPYKSPPGEEAFLAVLSADGKWLRAYNMGSVAPKTGVEDGYYFNFPKPTVDHEGNLYQSRIFRGQVEAGNQKYTSRGAMDLLFLKIRMQPQQPAACRIEGFMLIDATSNREVMPVKNGDVLWLEDLPASLNIKVQTATPVGSVRINWNNSNHRTENEAPYAVWGDRNGNYHGATLGEGRYYLRASAFSRSNMQGERCDQQEIWFEVKRKPEACKLGKFILVDADRNTDLMELKEGDVLWLDRLPRNLNLRVEANGAGSVRFVLNGNYYRNESEAPYALWGDREGNYHAGNFATGRHHLKATVYTDVNARGERCDSKEINFEVRRSAASLADNVTGELSETKLFAYPNPFKQQVNLSVELVEKAHVEIAVYDLHGKEISSVFKGELEQGSTQNFLFDGSKLPAGVYLARFSIGDRVTHQKLMLTR